MLHYERCAVQWCWGYIVYKFLPNSTLSPVKYWIQMNAGSKGLQKELNTPFNIPRSTPWVVLKLEQL